MDVHALGVRDTKTNFNKISVCDSNSVGAIKKYFVQIQNYLYKYSQIPDLIKRQL